MGKKNHHAALRLCVDNSSIDNGTPRSAASLKRGICQRPGIEPRLPHISIAFSETWNRLESSSAPPSRSTMVGGPFIDDILGTSCSERQELFVPLGGPWQFQPDDTDEKGWNPPHMAIIKTQEEQATTAFARFHELLADIGWKEEWALDFLIKEIAAPLGHGDKSVRQWYTRGEIPPTHVFNIGEAFGIIPSWLVGQTHLTKVQAIVPGGLYEREMEREMRRKQTV